MDFLLILAVVILFLQIRSLQTRIRNLELRLKVEPGEKSIIAQEKPLGNAIEEAKDEIISTHVENPTITDSEDSIEKFINWLKEDWILKLGALLILLGFGWLARYAILNNWIGIQGRITLGLIAGAGILAYGYYRAKKYLNQGSIFLVLGSSTILLTVFAARTLYNLFTPTTSLLIMFLASAFVAFASVVYKNRWLSLASLLLASLAPLLTNSPMPDSVGLFSYLFVVIAGTIWVTFVSGNRELSFAALIILALYSIPHVTGVIASDKGILLLFMYVFTILFFATSVWGILRYQGKEVISDLWTGAGSGLLLLWWILGTVPEEWKTLTIIAWTLVFLVSAFAVFRRTGRKEPFYVYAGVGLTMLATASAVEFEGAILVTALAVEAAMVPLVTYLVLREITISKITASLSIAPVILSLGYLSSYSFATNFISSVALVVTMCLTLLTVGIFYRDFVRREDMQSVRDIKRALIIGSSLYLLLLVWRVLEHVIIDNDIAVMLSLVMYTISGLAIYFHGIFIKNNVLRIYGAALLGGVVVRLLFVDIWSMNIAGRTATFFAIGALLVSTAFIGKKTKIPDQNE